MMHIAFSPVWSDSPLPRVAVTGDTITIDGDTLDLSVLPEGASIEDASALHPTLVGPIDRIDGALHLTLRLPHGPDPDEHVAFPAPLIVTDDGPVDLPFSAWSEDKTEDVDGGVRVTTTTHRWRQAPEVTTRFVPHPTPEDITETDEDDEHGDD